MTDSAERAARRINRECFKGTEFNEMVQKWAAIIRKELHLGTCQLTSHAGLHWKNMFCVKWRKSIEGE